MFGVDNFSEFISLRTIWKIRQGGYGVKGEAGVYSPNTKTHPGLMEELMGLMHGFEKIEELEIPEIAARAEVFVHAGTGAKLLSLLTEDENKSFAVSFRTPPRDSSGVAHILEHSVLCGSEKYPVKEPFVELLKGSLQTFLNALTFPDKTCYPVASTNEQDFHNLIDVYLDAVFHPRLTEYTLKQEGWHYEMDGPGGALSYKGVVFNEMKGAYSSPDSLLYEYSQQSLFPDTTYGLDSGGDPECIPDLTFEAFMEFHRKHYHPSNCYAFFYGNDDPEKRLKVLDRVFSAYQRIDPGSEVALQKGFDKPVRLKKSYAASDDSAKAMVTVNFALPEPMDPDLNLALHVLEHALIGLPSSPLRKALMDSGLGEDLAGVELEAELRQMYFSVGLKGLEPDKADKVEALVLDTLAGLANNGLDKGDVQAAVNSMEFALRENNTGSFPRGLSLLFRALTTWLHDASPLALLPFEKCLTNLKRKLETGEPVLENLLRAHFLENNHRSTVLMVPDPGLGEVRENRERERLERVRKAMSNKDLERVAVEAEKLKNLQETPDSPEDLATIPRLSVADLPRENMEIPLETLQRDGTDIFFHPLNTNSIFYLDMGFDLSALPDRLLPYVPVFGRALLEMGTTKRDYVELLRRMAQKTGGISPQTLVSPVRGQEQAAARLFLRGKATMEMADELLDIMGEIVSRTKFDDHERFEKIVLQAKARAEQRIVPAGHMLVAGRLKAHMNQAGFMDEMMHGAESVFFLRRLAQKVKSDFGSVLEDLGEIGSLVLNKKGLILNATLDRENFAKVEKSIAALPGLLPSINTEPVNRKPLSGPKGQGLSIPARINYVGKGLSPLPDDFRFTGAASVVSKFLRTAYLWEKVRVRGGAYGAFSMFDRLSGSICFVSYRDPNLDDTVRAFDRIGGYLEKLDISRDELEKSIIGAINEVDAYMLPDAKGFTSMVRRLTNQDEEYRRRFRKEILSASIKDFRECAEAVKAVAEQGRVVVLGEDEALKGSGLDLEVTKLL